MFLPLMQKPPSLYPPVSRHILASDCSMAVLAWQAKNHSNY